MNKGTPEENEHAKKVFQWNNDHLPVYILKNLGLSHVRQAMVGSHERRGVSGGERKRVTTGEMQFGRCRVQLLDEISTGLDAAATFDIVQAASFLVKNYQRTIIISLLQPPPEVLDLFDDILLLNDGYVIYHGPRTMCKGILKL
jgi:ABC-type multidrug transport system ATPase subunit